MQEDFPVFRKMKKSACSGCEACANSCPIGCITMTPDKEGFYFPLCDANKCIRCNKCIKTCPVLNLKERKLILKSYAGFVKDDAIVNKSASGGMFGSLMEAFESISAYKGYICGVAWNASFTGAEHIISDRQIDFEKIRSSKYVQSRKNDIFYRIKTKLDDNRYILFSGTPCEVAGLKGYLNRDYKNLFTVDIVCQGPTSPKAMEEFVQWIIKKHKSNIRSVNMRYVKVVPWIPQWIKIEFENGKSWCRLFYETSIGRAMHIMQRESCYICKFNGGRRCSDITIGDFHGSDISKPYYNPYGTSIIVINTCQGKKLFKALDRTNVYLEEVSYEDISIPNPRIIKAGNKHPFRTKFGSIFYEKGLNSAANASWSVRQKIRMKIPYNIRMKVREIKRRNLCYGHFNDRR